jgi:4a-hydroxytetrahydrobiopterin dehydratase
MNTPLSSSDISAELASLTGWTLTAGKPQIEKTYVRSNFLDAAGFIQKIAEIAERHDHHPDILLHGYKNVRVMLTTHDAGGITQKDFDVAKEIDTIA